MKTVYSPNELKKYLNLGEKKFLAGNKKMEVAFNVYNALDYKVREKIVKEGELVKQSIILDAIEITEPTLIALAIIFSTTIIAVVLILSGRKGKVKPTPDGPVLELD